MTRCIESLCPTHGFVEALVHDECPLCGKTASPVVTGYEKYTHLVEDAPCDACGESTRSQCSARSEACPPKDYRFFTRADWDFRHKQTEPPKGHSYRAAWETSHPAAASKTKE